MAGRAAICIGVNRPAGMPALAGCADDARRFAAWAEAQGCAVTLLVDTDAAGQALAKVGVGEIFDAIEAAVGSNLAQLIVYFSGHGILLAPGAEYWLLSRGPDNPNEAVNLLRSVEDARNTGIPHVVFISDACRSAADTPVLRSVTGGVLFKARGRPPKRSEVDVYYATLPGDPANEVPGDEAAPRRGLFTDCLLKALGDPPTALVETLPDPAGAAGRELLVITSRKLRDHLEDVVPDAASEISIKLNQAPEVRVETALPKYFAEVKTISVVGAAVSTAPRAPRAPMDSVIAALGQRPGRGAGATAPTAALKEAQRRGLIEEVDALAALRGRAGFETRTGFTIHGAHVIEATAPAWQIDPPFVEQVDSLAGPVAAEHLRLSPRGPQHASSILVAFDGGAGVVLPVLPGFVGGVRVDGGRVTSINFVPSRQSWRFAEYEAHADVIERMKAVAAVASRQGRFVVEGDDPSDFADRARQGKSIDPTLGLYAAYAYAQAGKPESALSVFRYMRDDEPEVPIPFDVALLALRADPKAHLQAGWRVAPFLPMLSQGWTLLAPGDTMHLDIHRRLRPHLVPALFTTLDAAGVAIVRDALKAKEVT